MDAKGIYLPNGDFMPFSLDSLGTEIASRERAGAALADLGSVWLNQLPDPDPILRKRGDDARILAELSADDQVTTATLSRKNRVLNAPQYGFRAGAPDGEAPSPEAQAVYERLMQDLERANMRSIISAILDAPFYGMAVLELMWGRGDDAPELVSGRHQGASGGAAPRLESGWWHMVDIVARPFHWFGFDMENQLVFKGENGFAAFGGNSGAGSLPPGKFVTASHHATFDNPYGLRLLSRCLWPVAFKRGGLEFYAKFVERHGMPWVVGKAAKGAGAQDKRTMVADMARMVRDCVAVLPSGAEIEFLAPANTSELLHERFIARQDKSISKLLMGQTLTVEMEGKNNSQAATETHKDVADDLADADKAMVTDAMNEIAWLYTRVNSGQNVFAPLFSYEEPEDLQARADLDKKLYDMGVEFLPEHFTDNYNLKPSEFTIRAQASPPPTGESEPALFKAAPGKTASLFALAEEAQARLDAAIKQIMPAALKESGKFVAQLENAVKRAKSPEQLELLLADLLAPHTAPSEMEALLTRTMTAVAGFGATAVQGERKDAGEG